MGNWIKVSKEELNKSYTIVNLKKGELQIQLAKALVREDKLREYIDGDEVRVYNNKRLSDSYKDGYARCCVDILQILNEGDK